MDENLHQPRKGSRAAAELATYRGTKAVQTAYAQAEIALTVAGDSMGALERALTEPVTTFAPWVLGRSVLESASVALWLLDLEIDPKTRISRSMSLRLSHLVDEAKYARSALERHPEAAEYFKQAGPDVKRRIRGLVKQAEKLEIFVKRDKNERLIGFGAGTPSVTELADTCGEAATYRMLSAAAHGRTWAQLALSLRRIKGALGVEQHLSVESALFLIVSSVQWFARAVWNYFVLNGWDIKRLQLVLEAAYDQVGLREELRFWRT